MAQSPLDDPTFPTAKAFGARATEPISNSERSNQRLNESQEQIARLRQQIEALREKPSEVDEGLGTAAKFGGRAALPPEQPKKKSIHTSEVLQYITDHFPSGEYIQRSGWPEEAKVTVFGLMSMLIGVVAGVHLNGEQIATYLKDFKDEAP